MGYIGIRKYVAMKKSKQKTMGRRPVGDKAMKQIAIRLPTEMLDEFDEIVAERYGHADRTAVIRELLAFALAERKRARK